MNAEEHIHEDHFESRSILQIDPTGKDRNGLCPPENLCVADTLDNFSRVKIPGKNVLIHFWTPSEKLKLLIEKTKFAALPTFTEVVQEDELALLEKKGVDTLSSQIFSELQGVLMAFASLLSVPTVKIELIKTQDRTCPLFHVDRVTLRLLCTLSGPGTEWLSDKGVNRKYLGRGENRKIIKKNALVYEAEPFQIVILKGNAYPGSSGAGIVHRSPAVPSTLEGRWLLRVDAA
jgi:hypothetical protein